MKEEKILVLYDKDEEYARLMCEYLLGCRNLPWKITACTSEADLKKICVNRTPSLLVTTNSCYTRTLEDMGVGKLVILSDGSGTRVVRDTEKIPVIEKYRLYERTPNLIASPVWGRVDFAELAAWVMASPLPWRMQLQMHKVIWGDRRGV